MKLFKREKIIIKTQSYVTRVTEKEIFVNDGSHLEYGLLVWVTGNTATDFVKKSGLPLSKSNRILVDNFFRVKGYEKVYALGDCSECMKEIYPATAQVAQQEGKYLGKSLNRAARNKKVKPFSFKNLGMLAYIGEHKALADIPQFKTSGFKAFLFWRSVYLTKLVSLKNKMLVLFDWFKTFVFGRDVSNF
jgi:NADH:quinone reductase (non-electrogenic)